MFKTIVTELDPRTERQLALARARQMAAADRSRVELLVCDYMDSLGGAALATGGAGADLEQAREDYAERLEAWLSEQAESLRAADIEVSAELIWHSPRYEAILEKAAKSDANLVMRAARPHSKLKRLLLGATDWELVRRAPQSVWLVKHERTGERDGLNVVAAVDPVHESEKKLGLDQHILDTAAHIASSTGGALHVFHAWQPGAAIAPAIAAGPHVPMPIVAIDADNIETFRSQREEMLRELAGGAGIDADHTHLCEGAVTETLDELVDAHDIDVVVAGAVARGRLERLIIGSTAEAILEHVDCDVVVVKPAAFDGAEHKE